MLRITFFLSLIFQCFIFTSAYADNTLPKLDCTLSDSVSDDEIGDAKNTFKNDTAKLYLYCESDEVEKGQSLKASWIAVDTNKVAPANYQIDEASIKVEKDLSDDEDFTAKFSISKPDAGWPAGTYVVKVYVDNQLQQSVNFSIK